MSQPRPVGLNSLHEARLITSLVEYYGWTLCADGNLYNPDPGSAQGEGDTAPDGNLYNPYPGSAQGEGDAA